MQNEKQKFKEVFVRRLIDFSLTCLAFCRKVRGDRMFHSVADQLFRSSTSIGANVVEAKGSASRKDYARFFEIALKSAHETKYWLIICKEGKTEFADEASKLLDEADQISKIIGSSLITLRGQRWLYILAYILAFPF